MQTARTPLDFKSILANRRSVREFTGQAVALELVLGLAWAGRGSRRRTASAPRRRPMPCTRSRCCCAPATLPALTPACTKSQRIQPTCSDGSMAICARRCRRLRLRTSHGVAQSAGILTICADLVAPTQAFAAQPPYGERGRRYTFNRSRGSRAKHCAAGRRRRAGLRAGGRLCRRGNSRSTPACSPRRPAHSHVLRLAGIGTMTSHLALYTFGIFIKPAEDPANDGFHNLNDPHFALVEHAAGFIARSGYADDPGPECWGEQVYPQFYRERGDGWSPATLSLWQDIEAAMAFTYSGLHAEALKRGKEWFRKPQWPPYAAWWVNAKQTPGLARSRGAPQGVARQGVHARGHSTSNGRLMPRECRTVSTVT